MTGDELDELERNRAARDELAGGRCEVAWDRGCAGWGRQVHHVRSRARGGTHGLANLRWVCAHCHGQIHAHPAEAEARGWLGHSWDDEGGT